MKKKLKTTIMQWLFLLVGMMTLLTSCHKDDDVEPTPAPTPEIAKPTTYTIMLYGCGGGNLDDALDYNLSQLEAHGKADRINFTGLIKFSKPRQSEVTMEGTRLFTLTNEGLKNEKVHDANYRMDNPAHLAQFIKDTKEKMPADKYILIFWNHGGEFGLADKLPSEADYTEKSGSRALLFDDNVDDNSLSAYEIEKGIKDSGTKMDLIYMDVCNMGMAEVNYQLRECTKYLMAASAPTPGIGGNYSELMEDLQTNDSLADAIKEYVPNCVKNWNNEIMEEPAQEDLECYDLSYMDEFAGYLKGAVGEFKKLAQETSEMQTFLDSKYDEVVCAGNYGMFMGPADYLHVFDGGVSVDVCSAFSRIANTCMKGAMSNYATLMKRTLDKMTVARAANHLPNWMDEVSMGLIWPTNSVFMYLYSEPGQFNRLAANLKNAALYQATGWGDLIASLGIPRAYKVVSPQGNDVYVLNAYANNGYDDYTWQYDIEFDLSNVSQQNVKNLEYMRDDLLEKWNANAEKHPAGLYLGKFVFDEAKDDIDACEQLIKEYGAHKLKLKVYVKGGVSPDDPYNDEFPAEIVEEIDYDVNASED